MTDFGDRMMDFLFDIDAGDELTADVFKQAMAAFPGEEQEVYDYCMIWVWVDWSSAHLPHVELTEAEIEAQVERSIAKLRETYGADFLT